MQLNNYCIIVTILVHIDLSHNPFLRVIFKYWSVIWVMDYCRVDTCRERGVRTSVVDLTDKFGPAREHVVSMHDTLEEFMFLLSYD